MESAIESGFSCTLGVAMGGVAVLSMGFGSASRGLGNGRSVVRTVFRCFFCSCARAFVQHNKTQTNKQVCFILSVFDCLLCAWRFWGGELCGSEVYAKFVLCRASNKVNLFVLLPCLVYPRLQFGRNCILITIQRHKDKGLFLPPSYNYVFFYCQVEVLLLVGSKFFCVNYVHGEAFCLIKYSKVRHFFPFLQHLAY